MKRKKFKVNRSTLFFYQASKDHAQPTAETDPTTSMITLTVTGNFRGA
jgi:hypothetical protein